MSSAGLSYDADLRPAWDEALLSLARTALDDPDAFEVVGDAHLEALDRGYTYFAWQLVAAPWSSEPWAMPARCPDIRLRFFLDGVEVSLPIDLAFNAQWLQTVEVSRTDGVTYTGTLEARPAGYTYPCPDRGVLAVQQTYDQDLPQWYLPARNLPRNNDGSGFNGTPRDLRVSKRRGQR